jgi:hypothetical protein
MAKNNNKYIFKYNQEGELYNYIELNKVDKIISYFKIEDSTLIRFDKNSDTKQLIKFKNKVKLKQKFMAGESFITVFDAETDDCVQYNMPKKEKQITLVKNNVSVSDFGKFVVERWKKLKLKYDEKQTKEPLTFSKSMYQTVLRLPVSINIKGTTSTGVR